MSINQIQTQVTEKFSILNYLPKNCGCTVCTATKEKIKAEVGEKDFDKISKLFNIK